MKYNPTWSEHEDKMLSDDPKEQQKYTDAFIAEREKEMSLSKKARDWESDRKAEWAKNKPEWVKEQSELEKDPSKKLINEIRDGGSHDYDIKPARGYLLIRIDMQDEELSNGLVIARDDVSEPNTAVVVAVGDELILDKHIVPVPVKSGARILFKKFAGMDIVVKGETLRMIQFSDVLGELL